MKVPQIAPLAGMTPLGLSTKPKTESITTRAKALAEKTAVAPEDSPMRDGQPLEWYDRVHELDEEDDERFLEFLRYLGVLKIGCSADDAARTVIVSWEDPAGRRVDVSDFPAFVSRFPLAEAP